MKDYKNPLIIAEIGANHKGDMTIAHEMIKTAALVCKVDSVKFQKRNNRELLTEQEYNAPHPNPANAYGSTYGEHREALEFSLDQHKQLKKWCEDYGVIYSTSVWDVTSAKEIASLNPEYIKIPSACNLRWPIYEALFDAGYNGEIQVSFGMTTREEEKKVIDFFIKYKKEKNLVIYACTSGYPVEDKDVCLLEISRIRKDYGHIVKDVGFSGHHHGISIDMAAYVLGATHFERHFTLDRTWKGTDHAASLEPDGMRRLARDLRRLPVVLTYKEQELQPVEEEQRKKLKRF